MREAPTTRRSGGSHVHHRSSSRARRLGTTTVLSRARRPPPRRAGAGGQAGWIARPGRGASSRTGSAPARHPGSPRRARPRHARARSRRFANALELGVTTLELDIQITEDGHAVVTHDRQRVRTPSATTRRRARPDDPEFPYVGKYIKDLTLAQVWTLDCGSRSPQYPDQDVVEGARIPLLSEVFALVDCYRANQVWFNIETKVEAGAPHETAPREQFVQVVARRRSRPPASATGSRSRASTGAR